MPASPDLDELERVSRDLRIVSRGRLRGRLQRNGECVECRGAATNAGYATIRLRRTSWLVHRLVWSIARGPVPSGMYVCHRCDNPRCCRLSHLFVGTPADNARDMHGKLRAYTAKTAEHRAKLATSVSRAWSEGRLSQRGMKLTADIARAIFNDPRPQRVVAKEYGVGQATVSHIRTGKTWSSVTGISEESANVRT